MPITLLQKPKRTLSNLSFQQLQRAKQYCRNQFNQYRQKFCYQPDWQGLNQNKSSKGKCQQHKNQQAFKITTGKHTYTVQGNKNKQVSKIKNQQVRVKQKCQKLRKKRPSTAKFSHINQIKQSSKIETCSSIFQNEHLYNALQQSNIFQKYKEDTSTSKTVNRRSHKPPSLHLTTPSHPNNFTVKTGVQQPSDIRSKIQRTKSSSHQATNQHLLRSILSSKQNFYNPYNIRPNNPYSRPVKHLRSGSIKQLRELCMQERNMNFTKTINGIQLKTHKADDTSKGLSVAYRPLSKAYCPLNKERVEQIYKQQQHTLKSSGLNTASQLNSEQQASNLPSSNIEKAKPK